MKSGSNAETAETLALRALGWIAAEEGLAGAFLAASGASASDLAERAGDPEFLSFVLDFLLAEDEPSADPARSLWRDLWTQLDWWQDAREYFREEVVPGSTRGSVLKLTGFLHDIGKPATKSFDETGRMRFFGHGDAGAEMAAGLMQRMRFS